MKLHWLIMTLLILGIAIGVSAFMYIKNVTRLNPRASIQPPESTLTDLQSITEPTLDVIAKDNQFTPDSFIVTHLASLTLMVTAQDKDYVFDLKDFNLRVELPKSQTTPVKIEGLGLGFYNFTCGEQCNGTVEVVRKLDADEEVPDATD